MKPLASIVFALALGAVAVPATSVVAPVEMTAAHACDVQMGRPNSCHKGYLESCRQYGYRGPCGLGGQRAGSGGYVHRPVYRTAPTHGHRYGNSYSGRYGSVAIPRAARTARAAPPPSPEQVARIAKHTITRVPVDCASGYSRVEGSNRCASVRWVPGED